MVLISLKGNAELGLGTLTYLIWVDYLKCVQFSVLLVAVLETAYVHHLAGKKEIERALMVDRTARMIIPFILYPWLIFMMILIGFQQVAAGITLFMMGLIGWIGFGAELVDPPPLGCSVRT